MANYNFQADLTIGDIGEDRVIGYLVSKGAKFIKKNKNNEYDVLVEYNGVEIKYEIKTDVYVAPMFDTGNIFIEVETRGKPSGLSVTKAKWFVTYFIYMREAWFIETDKLRKLLFESDCTIMEGNGDVGSNTKGYIIKRKDIEKHFKIVRV